MREHRDLVEGAIYRYRTGIVWRDLPAEFGPMADGVEAPPPVLHRRHLGPGTEGVAGAGGGQGEIDWRLSVDSTSAWVHQHGATAARSVIGATSHTGGTAE
jgi:transposase